MCFPRAFPSAEKAMVDSSAWLHAGWFSRACWVELAGGPCVSLAFFVRPGAYFTRRPLQHGRSLQHFLRRPGHSSSKVCSCWPSLTIEAHCPWRWRRRAKPCLAAWRRPRRAFRSPIALHPSLPRCFPPQHQAPPSCPAVLLSCLAVLCRRGQGHAVHVVQVCPVLVLLFQCGFQLCNEVVDVEVVIAAVGFGVCAVAVFHHGLPHRCPHFHHWHPPEASTDKKTASEYKTGSTRSGANYNSNARIFLLIQYAYNMPRPLGSSWTWGRRLLQRSSDSARQQPVFLWGPRRFDELGDSSCLVAVHLQLLTDLFHCSTTESQASHMVLGGFVASAAKRLRSHGRQQRMIK